MTYASNSPKRIMSNVSLNIKSRWMKWDQVRKNNGKQVISIATQTLKWFQKYSTTQIIRYKFIWHIIYKQNVPNMGVGKFWKENIKVLLEYRLFDINGKKMIIFLAWLLSKNPWRIQRNMCFFFNFVRIFVDVVTSCCSPNINFKSN
jgi:hypothetical protein